MTKCFLIALPLLSAGWAPQQAVETPAVALPAPQPAAIQPAFTSAGFMRHINYLASEELEGRGFGSEGLERAAEYIEREFRDAGLQPGGEADSFSQVFGAGSSQTLTGWPSLCVAGAPAVGVLWRDYVTLPVSSDDLFEGPVAFAGYGISNPAAGYDDYAGFDAIGKVLLVLRYEPHDADPKAAFGGSEPSEFATFRHKALLAREKGAKALLIVNPPLHHGDRDLLFQFDSIGKVEDFGIPLVHVSQEFAGRLLTAAGAPGLERLQRSLDEHRKPLSMDLKGLVARGLPGIVRGGTAARNVLGLLPGKGPHADEYIVVGAHYDHLGKFRPRRFLVTSSQPAIHYGADDNASGTSGLIELAHAFGGRRDLARSILFIAFSGEEEGLLGSKHFVEHPTVPLKQIAAMVNLDMIGRLRNGRLDVIGTDGSPEFPGIIEEGAKGLGFSLRTRPGYGGSDNAPFVRKGIPSLHFYTGTHKEYHRPTDTPATINGEGGAAVTELARRVVSFLEAAQERPRNTVAASELAEGHGGPRVRLGVVVGEPEKGQSGLVIGIVKPGGPAARAGIKPGDRLLSVDGQSINNADKLVSVLDAYSADDEAEFTILRDGKEINLMVKPAAP